MLYDILVKPFVKGLSSDAAAKRALRYFRLINCLPFGRALYRHFHGNRPAGMERTVLGIDFYNPVGLGPGFDLKGEIYNDLNSLGFSYVEIGPLNAERTRKAVENIQNNPPSDVLGACIAADYQLSFSLAYDFCDFFTIEVNDLAHIDKIMDPIIDIRLTNDDYKAIVVKLPEFCTEELLQSAVEYCRLSSVDGICTRNLQQTQDVRKLSNSRLTIIANVPLSDECEAKTLLDAGASLIELRNGLIHRGPSFVRRVIQSLENDTKVAEK